MPLPLGTLTLTVNGEVSETEDDDVLSVAFTSFDVGEAGGLRIPLPRPVGSLRTTHCDDLRISRGGKGGLFILKRIRS